MRLCSGVGLRHTRSLLFKLCIFFFKQKTAYEMLRSLVGSEMCIRDRPSPNQPTTSSVYGVEPNDHENRSAMNISIRSLTCLLYTSDAADDLLCVDLGGRRIIKKKKKHNTFYQNHTCKTQLYSSYISRSTCNHLTTSLHTII